jgi:hypothetical protein
LRGRRPYIVEHSYTHERYKVRNVGGEFATLDEAKAAAQADCDQWASMSANQKARAEKAAKQAAEPEAVKQAKAAKRNHRRHRRGDPQWNGAQATYKSIFN